MTWAQRLERVHSIDISICDHCGGNLKIIAAIEDLVQAALENSWASRPVAVELDTFRSLAGRH